MLSKIMYVILRVDQGETSLWREIWGGDNLRRMLESLKIYLSTCCQILACRQKLEPSILIQKYFATIYYAC
jgi:hypothetical protein